MKKTVLLGAVSLAMAACSSGDDADKDGDGEVSASEATAELNEGGKIPLQPGEYQMKITFTEIDAPGIPAAAASAMKDQMAKGMEVKNCVTAEQIENPGAEMFGGETNDGCKIDKLERSGNEMDLSMTCEQEGGLKMTSNMQGEFSSNGYVMNIDQEMSGMPTGDMSLKGKIDAKRLGDCPV